MVAKAECLMHYKHAGAGAGTCTVEHKLALHHGLAMTIGDTKAH